MQFAGSTLLSYLFMVEHSRGTHYSRAFKKGVKQMKRRNKDIEKLIRAIQAIITDSLKSKHKDHTLKGIWGGHRECHIEGDWILVYRWEEDLLILVDTGSHADVFGM